MRPHPLFRPKHTLTLESEVWLRCRERTSVSLSHMMGDTQRHRQRLMSQRRGWFSSLKQSSHTCCYAPCLHSRPLTGAPTHSASKGYSSDTRAQKPNLCRLWCPFSSAALLLVLFVLLHNLCDCLHIFKACTAARGINTSRSFSWWTLFTMCSSLEIHTVSHRKWNDQ